jgi:hypothetical protein
MKKIEVHENANWWTIADQAVAIADTEEDRIHAIEAWSRDNPAHFVRLQEQGNTLLFRFLVEAASTT